MNTELHKDVAKPQAEKHHQGPKKKKRKGPIKTMKPSVTYSNDELAAVEGAPFWNAIHQGQIKSLSADGAVVTIARDGGTIDVFVPREELMVGLDRNPGQKLRIYLEDAIAADAQSEHPFKGSEIKAIELDLLERAQHAKEHNEIITGYVIGEIKGGYTLSLFAESREQAENGFGLRAFLPLGRTGLRRLEGLSDHDDRLVSVHITEFDPIRGNIVVSRRELLAQGRKKDEEAFFEKIALGDQVEGRVSAVMPYGVFVNLGAIDGFLHISDISWDKKPRLKDLVPEGKEIKAKVIGIDRDNKKVKLSLKDMNADPWQAIDKTFRPGSEVMGHIVAFADFGAFVKLKDGVEGLIHMGEITWNRIKHPSQQFKIGDEVKALVLRVDKDARRISLSTKALETSPVERLSGQFPVGAVIKTKIASIHEFGLFVELDEATNGLVPRSEVSWIRNEDPLEKTFHVGQELEVAVLGYDQNRQRVSCSIKRTQEDPWQKWKTDFRKGSVHKVKVLEVNRGGVVCQLDGELTGFCPRKELAQSDGEHDRINVKIGEEIEMMIVAVEIARHRISLSQRALLESETKRAYETYLSDQGKSGGRTTLGDAFRRGNKLKG
jgi:small subunit ribosomal protein S1